MVYIEISVYIPWISMVYIKISIYTMDIHGIYRDLYIYHEKTKKYHNSTQNCPFSMTFWPKSQKFCVDYFPDVQRSKFLYTWWVLMIVLVFWFIKMTFFQRSKIRKKIGVPTASRPTRGGWRDEQNRRFFILCCSEKRYISRLWYVCLGYLWDENRDYLSWKLGPDTKRRIR